MFEIICIAALAGMLVGLALIFLAYFKDRSIVVPYILFFVFFAAFGVSAFLGLKSAGSTAENPSAQSSDAVTSDSLPEDSSQANDSPAPTLPQSSESPSSAPASGTNSLSIGDSATLGNWEISVTDFYYADKIETSPYTYFHPDEGNQYAVVTAQVTNNGTQMDTFLPSINIGDDVWANLYYANKYEYSSSVLLGVDKDLHNASINPLISKTGIIAFSVPNVVVNSNDSLSVTFSAGRDEITFSLR